jgi:hypothetical protein
MIGSTRTRRLGALLAGAVFVIALVGCTVGTTNIPAGQSFELAQCTAGSTRGPSWAPGPGVARLRLEVLSSDARQPLRAEAFSGLAEDPYSDFGTVWDGTKSTGPKHAFLPGGFSDTGLVVVYFLRVGSLSTPDINVKWALTALDANGKDVGFTTCAG